MYQLFIAGLGVIGLNELTRAIMLSEDPLIEPPVDTVSIIMPSYNEEKYIGKSLDSILNQSIIKKYPEHFEVIVVDGRSTDKTVKEALKYPIKLILEPKKGKLTARNTGIDNSKGNIIVATDSDRIYQPNWLNTLLKPFKDLNVVAVCGSNLYSEDFGLYNIIQPIGYAFLWLFNPNRLDGGNSAFRKDTFYKIGKFNDNIDQIDFNQVVFEEEINHGNKMSSYGKIMQVINATSTHIGNDKVLCRAYEKANDQCEIIGVGTQRF